MTTEAGSLANILAWSADSPGWQRGNFACDLDNNEALKLFVKLPSWFKIDAPIGSYNPDWAFVTGREEKLHFVRETKSTLGSEERRTKENQKIVCGRRHFETIGVDFDVVTSLVEGAI
jgi:type III restriction enzyme